MTNTTTGAKKELISIMYVEDDPDIQIIAKLALEKIGKFNVILCSSGKEALSAIEEGNQPDLILLDVMMPDMDGPTTLNALRLLPQTEATPTIFLTAKVQIHEIGHLKSLGALDVIAKPFDPMVLAQQIREIWEKQ